MLVALGVGSKQLAIFSHRAQEGNERSRGSAARLLLPQSYHNILTQSGCEMNDWGDQDSEEGGRDGWGEKLKWEQLVEIKSGDWCVCAEFPSH